VPELPQQSQRLVDARLQIGDHLLDSVDPPVDHHEALALGQGPDLLVRQPSGDEDEAVDRRRNAFRAAHQLEEHGVRDVGQEQSERARSPRRQCEGHRIEPVAQRLRGGANALLGLDADTARLVKVARNGRRIDTGDAGNVS
jgi:hypothetical protein